MAGVAVRICSCSFASFSTRSGVAWRALFDLQALVLDLQLARLALALSTSVNSRRDSYCVRTRYSALASTAQHDELSGSWQLRG